MSTPGGAETRPLDHALDLAQRAVPVFPCNGDKTPLTEHGFKDATCEIATVRRWWNRWPDALVAIATGQPSRLGVIDVDPDKLTDASREWLERHDALLHSTRTHHTRRGGTHHYFRLPENTPTRCAAPVTVDGVRLDGIDVRADGGYVIFWPAHGLPREGEVQPLPDALRPLFERPPDQSNKRANGHDSASEAASKIREGQRNEYLSREAYRQRKQGASVEQIAAVLLTLNQARCEPPLEEREVRTIAEGKRVILPDSERAEDSKPPSDEATVRRRIGELAPLSPIEYDQRRGAEAEALGIRVSTLDAEVAKLRPGDDASGIAFTDPEPWPEPVNAVALLDELRAAIERYVVLPAHAATAVTLWLMHAWTVATSFFAPILLIRSPTKRCGKTTLLLVLRLLVPRPLIATSASTAVIFRVIEKHRPTLLLDEIDRWFENEELRGVLNGGHSRTSAQVWRIVGDDHEPRAFSTFGPKVFAGIGRVIDTLEDRSIIVAMRRKAPAERVERLREDQLERDTLDVRRRCTRWAADHLEALRAADPAVPATLHDRAADNWRPLLAIADLAGGHWPKVGREAAVALSGESNDDVTVGVQLLGDIRLIFQQSQLDRTTTALLIETLALMDERSWNAFGRHRKQITPVQLAKLLRPFDIQSRTIRMTDKETAKGFLLEQFEDAFSRYLPK